jgi:F420-non-reducing hydrogenase large subunit
VCGLPGGISKALSEEKRQEIEKMAVSCHEFAKFTLKLFHDIVLGNPKYVDMIKSDAYTMKTYYMGMVDEHNKVNFYDGKIRVVYPSGGEFLKFDSKDYLTHIGEHVEEWTYSKFPFLKKVGWKGMVYGPDSGVYRVGPLGRLNASDGMATPLAQEEYEVMYKTLGGKPVHGTLAFHWARLIELLYATERTLELVKDPEITETNVRNKRANRRRRRCRSCQRNIVSSLCPRQRCINQRRQLDCGHDKQLSCHMHVHKGCCERPHTQRKS